MVGIITANAENRDWKAGKSMNSSGRATWIDDSTIREIVHCILSVSTPNRIILFGSAASGGMTRDSDIDLLVVLENLPSPRDESIRLREALRGLDYPFDVIVISLERFEESKEVIGGIAYPANKYGKIIYAAA